MKIRTASSAYFTQNGREPNKFVVDFAKNREGESFLTSTQNGEQGNCHECEAIKLN